MMEHWVELLTESNSRWIEIVSNRSDEYAQIFDLLWVFDGFYFR